MQAHLQTYIHMYIYICIYIGVCYTYIHGKSLILIHFVHTVIWYLDVLVCFNIFFFFGVLFKGNGTSNCKFYTYAVVLYRNINAFVYTYIQHIVFYIVTQQTLFYVIARISVLRFERKENLGSFKVFTSIRHLMYIHLLQPKDESYGNWMKSVHYFTLVRLA